MAAVLIGFVMEIAQGADGAPYSMLGAIAGVAYVVAQVCSASVAEPRH